MPPFVARRDHRVSSPEPSSTTPARRKVQSQGPGSGLSTADEKKSFLDSLADSSDEHNGSLSESNSSDFEDVLPSKRRKTGHKTLHDDDDGDDMDWEDAWPTASAHEAGAPAITSAPSGDLELTLGGQDEPVTLEQKKKGPSKIERQIRNGTHCLHVQFLMWHNTVRNAWCCDAQLQKILVEALPAQLQHEVQVWRRACGDALPAAQRSPRPTPKGPTRNQKGNGKKKTEHQRDWGPPAQLQEEGQPDISRGEPLLTLLRRLAAYWRKRFRITAPGLRKQGYKPLRELEEELRAFRRDKHDPALYGERITGIADLRRLARNAEGSRDVGAQLFVALLRGLGIEARMVANLQPIGFGWSKSENAVKAKKQVKHKAITIEDSSDEDSVMAEPSPRLQPTWPTRDVSERKRKAKLDGTGASHDPISLSDTSDLSAVSSEEEDPEREAALSRGKSSLSYDKDLHFPHYWAEAISPISHEVYAVDPMLVIPAVATDQAHLALFEPRGAQADRAKQVMAYVIAHSPDGTAKDVTTRYLKRHMWPGKTKGFRMPAEKVPILHRRGKIKRYEQYDWFKRVMSGYIRRHLRRTAVDDIEEAKDLKPVKMEKAVAKQGEDTLQSYKQSAEFVLERHLRREEAILPTARPVKYFKNGKGDAAKDEPVYRRKDVVLCKTHESWHKEGRQVRADEWNHAMKEVPIRAVTLTRKREVEEAARQANGVKPMQGLYSREQTEYIIPPPIQNGIIPKNDYGNIDCFVPTMVPGGAVHIPLRSTVRICKKLEIDYAEAVTGFEFGNKRAVPVIQGVVVAAEHEEAVLRVWEEDEAARQVKEDEKRNKLILSTWRKFLMGLRIVERVRDEYGETVGGHVRDEINPFTNRRKAEANHVADDIAMQGGGFLADDEEHMETNKVNAFAVQSSPDRNHDQADGDGGFVIDEDVTVGRKLPGIATHRLSHANGTDDTLPEKGESDAATNPKPAAKGRKRASTGRKQKRQQKKTSLADEEDHPSPSDADATTLQTPKRGSRQQPTRSSTRPSASSTRSRYFEPDSDVDDAESMSEKVEAVEAVDSAGLSSPAPVQDSTKRAREKNRAKETPQAKAQNPENKGQATNGTAAKRGRGRPRKAL